MNRLSINSWFLSCLVFHCLLVLEEWHILHDRPWITPWIKSISNELDFIFHVRTSQRHVNCDVITNVAKSFVVTNCVVYALTLELFWCSFPSWLRDSANIHQNNPPWAHKTVRHSNQYIIVRRAGLLWSQQDFEWRWSVPLFKCLTVLEFSFILFDLCLLITFFNFIMNYVPIVTFWIFTYHKIWILSIMFCFIWSYWIIYFLACLEVSWRVVS